jgi:hypothetical protein
MVLSISRRGEARLEEKERRGFVKCPRALCSWVFGNGREASSRALRL